ncbi:MAG: pyridoxamine 5'-phosphate oxidase family protein [Bacteroidia bacterium]
MGKLIDHITPDQISFIAEQKLFFVATAASDGFVNVSPKGLDTFKILDQNKVLWLNLTGSGNETAAHLLDINRITLMFCSFNDKPLILRLYGKAKTIHKKDAEWPKYAHHFKSFENARQIFEVDIEATQASCGYGVPMFEFKGDRINFDTWVKKKGGEKGMEKYWKEKNSLSINGKTTGI